MKPTMNSAYAKQVISLHRFGNLTAGALASLYTFKAFVYDFMYKHPRGKGTAGQPDLQEVYAACHALNYGWSQSRDHASKDRIRAANPNLTTAEAAAIKLLPGNGTKLEGREAFAKYSDATWAALYDKGYAYLWYEVARSRLPCEGMLTDLGIKARESLLRIEAARADAKRVADEKAKTEARERALKTIAEMVVAGDDRDSLTLREAVELARAAV